jgi:hypothetical protein
VKLNPIPAVDYPTIEQSLVPLEIPDFESDSSTESVPVPVPDPAT